MVTEFTLSPTAVERLTLLRDYLIENEQLIWPRLNLKCWRGERADGETKYPTTANPNDTQLKNDCKTVGCIVGWASSDAKFKKLGLKFQRGYIIYKDPTGVDDREYYSYVAVHKFLDLPEIALTYDLISPTGYGNKHTPTLNQVLKKIDNIFKEYGYDPKNNANQA